LKKRQARFEILKNDDWLSMVSNSKPHMPQLTQGLENWINAARFCKSKMRGCPLLEHNQPRKMCDGLIEEFKINRINRCWIYFNNVGEYRSIVKWIEMYNWLGNSESELDCAKISSNSAQQKL